jgi:FdhD protein
MRTPGDDDDLVRGWLYTERLIGDVNDVRSIDRPAEGDGDHETRVLVTVASSVALDHVLEHRSLSPTSACGLCGRVAIDRLDAGRVGLPSAGGLSPRWTHTLIAGLPSALLTAQTVFAATGGLHAAGLFDDEGTVQFVREDIGRHNAVDKVIGAALAAGCLRERCSLLVVSGRIAFEIVQKAAVGGQLAVVAVGAPSDLAVDAARAAGMTLVGFARDGRFNVYAGIERIHGSAGTVSVS